MISEERRELSSAHCCSHPLNQFFCFSISIRVLYCELSFSLRCSIDICLCLVWAWTWHVSSQFQTVFLSHTDVKEKLSFNLQVCGKNPIFIFIIIFFLTDVAWKALKPVRTIIKCTFINMFEVQSHYAIINKAL